MSNTPLKSLSKGQLMKIAPSIFEKSQSSHLTDKYMHISTSNIITDMRKLNWQPVRAREIKFYSNRKENGNFNKHLVVFRNSDIVGNRLLKKGEIIPEVWLTNAHNGKCAEKMYLGLTRCVCDNQMVVKHATMEEMRIVHVTYSKGQLEKLVAIFIKKVSLVSERIGLYQSTKLDKAQKFRFAKKVLNYKSAWVKLPKVTAESILQIKRKEDESPTLWHTYNTIQENILKGKIKFVNSIGKTMTSKAITGINAQINLNQYLWQTMDNMVS